MTTDERTSRRGRRPVLDEFKRREILAILSVGCSRRTAARYVGCAVQTIHNTSARDPAFAAQLAKAGQKAEIGFMNCIQRAATKEQYWRAAAWALERLNPEEFAPRPANAVAPDDVRKLLTQLAEALVDELPAARHRQQVLRKVDALMAELESGDDAT